MHQLTCLDRIAHLNNTFRHYQTAVHPNNVYAYIYIYIYIMHFKTLPYKLLYYFAKRALIWKHTHTQHYNLDSSHFQKLAGVGLTHYLITTPKHCSKKVTDSVHDINYHIYIYIHIPARPYPAYRCGEGNKCNSTRPRLP